MKYDIYLAGPLFSMAERDFNSGLTTGFRSENFSVYLPQETGLGTDPLLAKKDLEALRNSSMVVAILDGVDVDSGTAFEIGYAYALNKKVIGFYSDIRITNPERDINLIVYVSCFVICTDKDSLYKCAREVIKIHRKE